MGCLRWQALRPSAPLRAIAGREQTCPIALAAAHTVDGLQGLLEVIGAGQSIATADVEALPGKLRAARESLTGAIADVDVPLELLDDVDREHAAFTRGASERRGRAARRRGRTASTSGTSTGSVGFCGRSRRSGSRCSHHEQRGAQDRDARRKRCAAFWSNGEHAAPPPGNSPGCPTSDLMATPSSNSACQRVPARPPGTGPELARCLG
jgi:hypothetical protein